jgi:hypothetical protein
MLVAGCCSPHSDDQQHDRQVDAAAADCRDSISKPDFCSNLARVYNLNSDLASAST